MKYTVYTEKGYFDRDVEKDISRLPSCSIVSVTYGTIILTSESDSIEDDLLEINGVSCVLIEKEKEVDMTEK